MERFLVDNKYKIPPEKIDDIYVWTRISRTQELLIPSVKYYMFFEESFKNSTKIIISELSKVCGQLPGNLYRLSDYITFALNEKEHLLFKNKGCLYYTSNLDLLYSMICYIIHTKYTGVPKSSSLEYIITNIIDEPDVVSEYMNSTFFVSLNNEVIPPYNNAHNTLNSFFTKRSKLNRYTLLHLPEKVYSFMISNKEKFISKESLNMFGLENIDGLVSSFKTRREQEYRDILSLWFSKIDVESNILVYSESEPKSTVREVKYE